MPEVVVVDPELSVYGPVEEITVSVDIGQTGVRGSKQFVGAGLPGSSTISETPLSNDMYLDISTGDIYQYIDSSWDQVGNLVPEVATVVPLVYNVNETVTFISGNANFTYDIEDMFNIMATSQAFVIQHNIIGTTNVIASVITEPILTGTELDFSIKAKSLSGTTWSNLSGDYDVMISISLGEDNTSSAS
jgi:hypothetical protein